MGKPKKISTPSTIQRKPDGKQGFTCSCCGKEYVNQKPNFPASQSPLYAGNGYHLTICRNCLDELFKHYTEALGSEEEAIRRICMKFDIYYCPSLVDASKKISLDRSRLMTYISRANLRQYKGNTYDTTIDEETSRTIDSIDDLNKNNEKTDTEVPIVSDQDIAKWGYGFEPLDYRWLNDNYNEIRSTNVIDTTTRNELVCDYCRQKLLANKALRENQIDRYSKLSDMAQKTLDRANLTPKIEDANDKAGEKPMGVMIQMFEKEEPIPEPRPEWKDVDGIVHLITVYFLGHLSKMLNLHNRYSALYEEEMDRYRAEVPELESATDEDIFESLINGGTEFLDNTPEGRGDV